LAFDGRAVAKTEIELYNSNVVLQRERNQGVLDSSTTFFPSKPLQILQLLSQGATRKTVYTVKIEQLDLARKLRITRQALSSHFKKLRESGFVQIGRGFVNVTEDGLRALGYRKDPVIVTVRILPQRRTEAFEKIKALSAIEIFKVAGDADAVIIVGQDKLNSVLEMLASIDGVVETKSLVSMVCC